MTIMLISLLGCFFLVIHKYLRPVGNDKSRNCSCRRHGKHSVIYINMATPQDQKSTWNPIGHASRELFLFECPDLSQATELWFGISNFYISGELDQRNNLLCAHIKVC